METRIIKADLIIKGVTQTSIAKSLDVSVASVNDVISGKRSTPRIRLAIAEAIGKPVSEIWPAAKTNKEEAA